MSPNCSSRRSSGRREPATSCCGACRAPRSSRCVDNLSAHFAYLLPRGDRAIDERALNKVTSNLTSNCLDLTSLRRHSGVMDLSPYIESVRAGVASASSLADEHTQQVADRLGTAIESSTRLALIQALSDAAGTISADLAPSSVELRIVGQDPEFVVSVQTAETEPTLLLPNAEPGSESTDQSTTAEAEDEPVARITLRLPQSVKARVDEMASSEGISTNAWLIRAVMDALADRGSPRQDWPLPPRAPVPPSPDVIFGSAGPLGPRGVINPEGAFGPGGPFGERLRKAWREQGRSRGNVQGWVR